MKNKNVFFRIISVLLLGCFMGCKTEIETPKVDSKENNVTISYISTEGKEFNEEKVVPAGYEIQKLDLLELSSDGYSFLGWYLKGEKVIAGQKITKDSVFVAKWENKNVEKTYTVNFDSNGHGSVPKAITNIKEGTTLTADQIKPMDNVDGFTFTGWLCNGKNVAWPVTITGNLTLTAQWKKIEIVIPGMTGLPVVKKGHNGTAGTKWTYVEFGIWPQTKYSGDETALKTCANINAWDNCYTDGNGGYYVKVKATPDSSVKEYTSGNYYYFKLEPIQWRVLTNDYNGKKLLLAEKALDAHRYHASSNKYDTSEIRAYLNGMGTFEKAGFLQKAFTPEQINAIADTEVDNSALSTIDAGNNLTQATDYACANTTDKIFLLSEKEVTTTGYGFDVYGANDTTRRRTPTDYAKATGINFDTYNSNSWWWLRSPYYYDSSSAHSVYNDGDASLNGLVDYTSWGVVPALSISF